MTTVDISPYLGPPSIPLVTDIDPNQFLKEDSPFFDSYFPGADPCVNAPVSPHSDSSNRSNGLGSDSNSSVTSLDAPGSDTDVKMNPSTPTAATAIPAARLGEFKTAIKTEPAATAYANGAVPATTAIDGNTLMELLKEQDVKRARLARKAELARMSRKRKKMRMQDLERDVSELRTSLEREKKLRKIAQDECRQMQEATKKAQFAQMMDTSLIQQQNNHQMMQVEAKELNATLKNELQKGNLNVEALQKISEGLKNLTQRMVSANAAHLAAIRQQMNAPMPLAFVEWVLNQRDAFYEDRSGLWNSLFHSEIGLSQEQMDRVFALRNRVREQKSLSNDVQNAFTMLQTSLKSHTAQASQNMQELMAVFTPTQLAKFFSWVDTYGKVCVKINV